MANGYFTISDFQNARIYYEDSIISSEERKRPRFLRNALYYLGFMHLLLEQTDDAGKIIDKFEKNFPDSHKLSILKGYYRSLNGDFKGAVRIYRNALKNEKHMKKIERATINTLIGDAYRETALFEKAEQSYNKALNLIHVFPAANHGKAKLLMMRGDIDSSLKLLDKVIYFDSYNFHAMTDKAYLLLIKGDGADKVLPLIKKAVSLNPPHYKPYLLMGCVQTVLGVDGEAERYFTKARDYNAEEYKIIFNKSWSYFLRGDTEKQKYYLSELLKLKGVPQTMRNKARTLLSQ
jgi:tetratricopeptide (TPR) repeat protein